MVNPPERVLHHALLYRDGNATLAPDEPSAHLDKRVRCAHEARLHLPVPTGSLWRNAVSDKPSVRIRDLPRRYGVVDRNEVRNLVLKG